MSSATLELYHALVAAGVPEEKAEQAAKAVISREEAKELLATKADLYRVAMGQTAISISSTAVLLAMFRLF